MASTTTIRDVLAPPYINRGRQTAIHPNRVCVIGDTSILFCRSTSGAVFGVRIDTRDLARILSLGVWRVADFGTGRNLTCLYCYTTVKHKIIYLHRLVLNAPKGEQVDHRHRRTLDNRRAEIRIATGTVNQLNRRSKREFRNVYPTGAGKFMARVGFQRKDYILGHFPTPEEASSAVNTFLIEKGVIHPTPEPTQ